MPVSETKQINFEKQLAFGKEFEDEFARWLLNKGWHVVPKYLYAKEGAPLLIGKAKSYAVPDIDCAKNGTRIWVECKRKNKMLYHPATGYPKSNHICYKEVQKITGSKVFVIFKDESENKTYGNWLNELEKYIYKDDFLIQNKPHILFKYPEGFLFI